MNSEPFYPVSLCLRLPPPSARDGCHASDRALLRSLGSPQTPLCGFPSVAAGPFQSFLSVFPACLCPDCTSPHPTLSRGAVSRACGWPAPFPCPSAVILLFLAPHPHDALHPVTSVNTRPRASALSPSQPQPKCLPCSPVLLQCRSPKPPNHC